jgi:hypothetical protein
VEFAQSLLHALYSSQREGQPGTPTSQHCLGDIDIFPRTYKSFVNKGVGIGGRKE